MSPAARLAVVALLALSRPAIADEPPLPVPRGTRRADEGRFASSRGFGAAVEFYRRELARRGLGHQQVGPYRSRGVDVARFVSSDPRSAWLAVHVYRQDGKTWISFVNRPAGSARPAPSPP